MAGANVSIEQGVALIETLAEKNIKGAEAGTQLRNVILKLQSSNIGYVNGVFDINAALDEMAAKNLNITELTKFIWDFQCIRR